MIQLKNLSKTYATKNKDGVRALDDVNLTFPDKGFCLVVGKSGCGKTTLLNILGGLDVKYEGDFIFLNKKLTAKDFADYRKNYVSFVFQDFNLIEDLDVGENLSIGYNFASKDDDNKQEDVLKKVGLDDYAYRFPQELSGGEQQRVAIARALLKDSKVLLADEPTGNLDKENSVDIYKLLKEISLKKLVIVVSHDEQLAREYADYVVRLEDGKVVESDLPQSVCSEQYVVSKRKAIRAKIAWQMAWYEFTRKKSRSILTVIALIIFISLLAVSSPILFYNSADPHYNIVTQQGYDRVLLNNLTYDSYCKLLDEGVNLALSNVGSGNSGECSLVFQSKEEAESYGIEFYPCDNELPLAYDNYYISDKYLKEIILYGNNVALIDGKEIELNLTDYELTDVVGGKLAHFGYALTCAGVYRYPEQSYEMKEDVAYRNDYYGRYITMHLSGLRLGTTFVKLYYDDKVEYISSSKAIGVLTSDKKYINATSDRARYVLLDESGNISGIDDNANNHLLEEGGLYINLNGYNRLFNKRYSANDLLGSMVVPDKLGTVVCIEVENKVTNTTYTIDGLVLKGIVINTQESEVDKKIWFGSQEDLQKYALFSYNFCAWADVSTIKPLHNSMRAMSRDYGIGFYTPTTSTEEWFSNHVIKNLRVSVTFVTIAMCAVTLMSVGILISGQILSRKREVGIFKALGAQSLDISAIYVYEMIVIAAIVAVLSVALAVAGTALINLYLDASFSILSFSPLYALLSVGVTLVLFTVGTFLPLLRLNNLNVIDSIRSKAGK